MTVRAYIFERGTYSDRSQSVGVVGPADADLVALWGEFCRAAEAAGAEWPYEARDAMRVARGEPTDGYGDANDAFAEWLVAAKGWALLGEHVVAVDGDPFLLAHEWKGARD